MKNKKSFKSGFAAIIGMPNVGKSTLLNTIVGQKIAIISDKPQTTRNKILAIYSTDEEQIIFTDTPGIHKPHNKLGEYMVHVANESMDDTDVLIFVVDASKKIQETEREIAKNISKTGLPCILVLNKVDLMKKEDLLPIIADYSSMHDFASIVPVSAKNNDGVDILLHDIEDYLEEGPEFYDSDMVTDQPEKQIAAEIIREKLMRFLGAELPYSVTVEIERFVSNERGGYDINGLILVEREGQKKMVIGNKGAKIKTIGIEARKDMQEMFEAPVHLELWVKVKSGWADDERALRSLGYVDDL